MILDPAAIRTFREPRGLVTENWSKLAILAYFGHICMLLVTDFGSCCNPNILGTPGSSYANLSELAVLAYFGQFSMQLVTDFGSRYDTDVSGTSGSGYRELVKTRSFGLFWLVLHAIAH